MQKIGVIAPRNNKRLFKPELIYDSKHNITFVIVNDNKNYKRIFKKMKIPAVVSAENARLRQDDLICTGINFFKNNLMYFLVKQYKIHKLTPEKTTLAVVFDKYNDNLNSFVIKASKLFKTIIFVTNDNVENVADRLWENYGMCIEIKSTSSIIKCDISVELDNFCIRYKNYPVVININSNIIVPNEYNITIPIKVNKAALAEALIVAKQNIDN